MGLLPSDHLCEPHWQVGLGDARAAVTTLLGDHSRGPQTIVLDTSPVASAQLHHLFLGDRGPRTAVTPQSGCPTPPPAASALPSEPEGQTCSRPHRPEHHPEASPHPVPSPFPHPRSSLWPGDPPRPSPLPELSHCLVPPTSSQCSPGATSSTTSMVSKAESGAILQGWVRCHPSAALVPASSLFRGAPLGPESLAILGGPMHAPCCPKRPQGWPTGGGQ